ncbi:MAG: hypothetical protein LBU29_03430 [Endomicrobium sp.]|jgi:hypothetical protein|nr:hypothetical protein [Endomicrobium sp.]
MADDVKKSTLKIKICVVLLFLCGVGMWFSIQPICEQKIRENVALDKKIINCFVAVKGSTAGRWCELYRKIRFKSIKIFGFFKRAVS